MTIRMLIKVYKMDKSKEEKRNEITFCIKTIVFPIIQIVLNIIMTFFKLLTNYIYILVRFFHHLMELLILFISLFILRYSGKRTMKEMIIVRMINLFTIRR